MRGRRASRRAGRARCPPRGRCPPAGATSAWDSSRKHLLADGMSSVTSRFRLTLARRGGLIGCASYGTWAVSRGLARWVRFPYALLPMDAVPAAGGFDHVPLINVRALVEPSSSVVARRAVAARMG